MVRYRKLSEPTFSVHRASKSLRRVSPALVSLVVQGKRNITLDRADEFARLLNLNAGEKLFLKNWILQLEGGRVAGETAAVVRSRRDVGTGILSDWLNVYVKDFFLLAAVRSNPELIERQLMAVATPKRIQKCLEFLLRQGYLRRGLDGSIQLETQLAVAEPNMPSRRIRQFHKGALSLAKAALELYPKEERMANTLTIALDDEGRAELVEIINDFAERLKEFASRKKDGGNRLYQLIVNLSPVGGKLE